MLVPLQSKSRVGYLFRDSDPAEVAESIVNEIADLLES